MSLCARSTGVGRQETSCGTARTARPPPPPAATAVPPVLRRPRRLRFTAAVGALGVAAALVLTAAGPASADDDPVGGLTGQLERQVGKAAAGVTGGVTGRRSTAQRPSSPPPAPSSQDEAPGNEIADPTTPDHGGSTLADAQMDGESVLTAGQTRSDVDDDDSTRASSTLLSLGGQRLVFADADSEGDQSDSQSGPEDLGCTESEGQICLGLLYADANATDDGDTSHSESNTGVLVACFGDSEESEESDPEPQQCEGPIGAGVAQSASQADRDQRSGRTTASSETGLLVTCLGYDGESCALEAAALYSEGESDSGGATSSASRDSGLVLVGAGGDEIVDLDTPAPLTELPIDCDSLVCAYLDQGETYLGDGIAGHAQEALRLQTFGLPTLLPGGDELPVFSLVLGRSETLVHNDGGEPEVAGAEGEPEIRGAEANRAPAVIAGARGGLPNTGGPGLGLLAVGLLALGSGSLLVAGRRTRLTGA